MIVRRFELKYFKAITPCPIMFDTFISSIKCTKCKYYLNQDIHKSIVYCKYDEDKILFKRKFIKL